MKIDFDKMGGLVPAIIQDAVTKNVLMLGFMNEEAYQKTIDTKKVTFWSRTRNCLWTKGETSGNYLNLVDIRLDCDNDTLLVKVHPQGPTCHLGTDTCWGEDNSLNPILFLSELQTLSTSAIRKCLKIATPPVFSRRASTRWPRRWAKRPQRPSSRLPMEPTSNWCMSRLTCCIIS